MADEDFEFVKNLKERFLAESFRVFTVNSGRDAVSCVRKRKINITIIDVNLKDMKGYAIVPLIKDINKEIKVNNNHK
ncbi:response regulator [candidate division KSB1 bacterium]